jgi:salicylate hydroxylase
MTSESFLIAGGGIAGLATAIGLAGTGRRSTIFEQSPVFEEIGAGIQLGPNAVRALKYLGTWDFVAPKMFSPAAMVIRDGASGGILQRIDLGSRFEERFGEPYRVIHRADLQAGLLSAAYASKAVTLRCGAEVEGFTEATGSAVVRLAGGETCSGAALIGADGVGSTVRRQLLDDGPPRRSGHIIYRALVPTRSVGWSADHDAVTLWLCPGKHVVHYPVASGDRLNIVAVVPGFWDGEGSAASGREIKAAFPNCADGLARILSTPTEWTKWTADLRKPASSWSRGTIGLIGDAAHPMLPFLAQGAAMALEDAAELVFALSAESTVEAAFRRFEVRRRKRCARAARASQRQALIYHAKGAVRFARDAAFRVIGPERFVDRLAWLYDWQAPPPLIIR